MDKPDYTYARQISCSETQKIWPKWDPPVCLTVYQARYIYKEVEQDSIFNVEMIKQEIEDILDNDSDNEGEENPNQNIIINEIYRDNIIVTQME